MEIKNRTRTERRKTPRFQCSPLEDYTVDFKDQKETGYLMDLSRRGLALQSPRRLRKNETYKLKIRTPFLKDPVPCESRIVWVRPQQETKQYTCGARILMMDPSLKFDLLDILYQKWKEKVTRTS